MKLWAYEALIFDLDGTLIDSERYHAQAFADAVLEQSGYRLVPDEWQEFFGKHTTWLAEELNDRHGLALEPDKVLKRKRARVQEIFEARPFEGVREFLTWWKGKRPMALATNSPRSFVMPALKAADLLHFFDAVTTADEVVHRKPHPEIVERTVQKLGVDPLKSLVFEDQLIGIQAARAAGTAVVAVDNGQHVDFPSDVPLCTWAGLIQSSKECE
ncbi:MAG: HAD family phosphatase [Pontiellaceae bacterium]|nr:HAD family phosphatase [Pontiellaceae bacterium]MBN2785569.1 HAD family phosphatase [Pontiellaceae bacterium]